MPEEQTEPQAEEQAPKKRAPIKLMVIGLATLVLIGGGAVGAKILLGGEAADADEAETATPTEGEEPATFGHIVSLEPFTVNLDENAGSRYLRVKINLEIENESFEQDFNTRLPVIRDVILLLLSGLTYDSISSPTGKQDLKDQIVERVNTIMRGDVVRRVLFEDFLVQ